MSFLWPKQGLVFLRVDAAEGADATRPDSCLDPTEPTPKLAARAIDSLTEVRHLFVSEPTEQDVVYESLKTVIEAGNQRAALRLGRRLAADLPQGPILASNIVLRAFPGSRRARRMVESFATTTTDPMQRNYLLDLKRSYFS